MQVIRYLMAGALTGLLVASLAYEWWSDRPYVVTGHQWDNGAVTVDFTLPGGGEGNVRWDEATPWGLNCYAREVRVGESLPFCMRSFKEATEAYPLESE